jgi:hypothetical protein
MERGMLLAIVLAGAVAISPNVADPDLWGHVQYGRDTLQYGLAHHTTYSYIAQQEEWINHENLAEIVLAVVADTLGPFGLLAFKLLAGIGLLLLVLAQARKQQASLLTCTVMLLLTACGLARFWSLRPQLFSFLAYAVLLALLSWIFTGWEGRAQLRFPAALSRWNTQDEIRITWQRLAGLWAVPFLMVAWTNAHGGFLAGECIYTAYLFLRGCEYHSQGGRYALGFWKRVALMIFGAWLATLCTPYGPKFLHWLWHDLRVPRPEIVEWLPPNLFEPQAFPLVLLIITFAVCLAGSRLSWDATHGVILVLTLWQSLMHERHIPFFALSVAFFLPQHVEDVLRRLALVANASSADSAPPERIHPFVVCGLVGAFVLLGVKLGDRLAVLKVLRHEQPVAAVEFMAEHQLTGRLVCAMNWAQYVLYASGSRDGKSPGLLVQIDGRLRTAYTQAMLDTHFDFILGEQTAAQRYRSPTGTFQATRVLQEKQPNLVLIDRGQPHAVQVMEGESHEWSLLYQDSLAQLWGRKARYDDPASPDYFPPTHRRITDTLQSGYAAWPAVPQRSNSHSINASHEITALDSQRN